MMVTVKKQSVCGWWQTMKRVVGMRCFVECWGKQQCFCVDKGCSYEWGRSDCVSLIPYQCIGSTN